MEKCVIEILGYYLDRDEDELNAYNVFVALYDEVDGYTCYCPIGQHSSLDYGYLEECREITAEQYKKASNGLYTPKEYL